MDVAAALGDHGGLEAALGVLAGEFHAGAAVRDASGRLAAAVVSPVSGRRALDDERGFSSRFLDDLLQGRLGTEDDVRRQAAILGIDLGFYGVLAQAVDPERLESLGRDILAPLVREDSEKGTRYVPTLGAYLRADRRLKPARRRSTSTPTRSGIALPGSSARWAWIWPILRIGSSWSSRSSSCRLA
jgi:hypothetical protein